MADNFVANPGAGGDTFAADDVLGVKVPYSKIDKGADGVSSPVTDANPMPAQITDGTNPVGVRRLDSNVVNTDYGVICNAVIHGETTAGGGSFVDVKVSPSGALQIEGDVGITGTVTVDTGLSQPLTDSQLRATAVPVSGTVSVTGVATETTLSALNTKIPAKQTGVPGANDEYLPIASIPAHQLRIGFDKVISNNVDTAQMTLLQTGSGQTVNQSGGSLVITTGITANSETIIRSVETVEASIVERWSALLSQRIANQNFYIELVDVIGDGLSYTLNSTTSMTITIPSNPFTSENVGQGFWVSTNTLITAASQRVTIASVSGNNVTVTGAGWPASGSGLCDVFGWNYIQARYTGVTATNVDIDAQRNGWATGATTATINTTASTHIGVFAVADGELVFMDQTNASATGLELTQRASRVRNVPDSDIPLYLQIRVLNGTTAPASTTTFTCGFVDIQHAATQSVALQNVAPMSSNSGLPVNLVGSITQTVSGTVTANIGTGSLAAGTNAIGDVGIQYRANATGAATRTHLVSAANTNPTVVKASAGRLLGVCLSNTNAAFRYVKFHNQTTSPTAGTGVVQTIAIPPNNNVTFSFTGGIAFTTGIALTCVTGAADTDATAVGANDIVGDIFYA